jgi:hypothetical protein
MPELFDAPSDLIAVIFPDLKDRKDVEKMTFTSLVPCAVASKSCRTIRWMSEIV